MDKESAKVLLSKSKECAIRAGIYDKMFIGFGTALGAIRERDLIDHDDDMDICFLPCTKEEKWKYLNECIIAGLLRGWDNPEKRQSISDSGEVLWFSIKETKNGTKSCNWFFVDYDNKLWHTKGKHWVNEYSFQRKKFKLDDDAIMLGADKKLFDKLVEIPFLGGSYNIPVKCGELCDFYYPNWLVPKEGGSSEQVFILRVPRWNNEAEWSLI